MRIDFNHKGEWAAYNAAKQWCQMNGISVGQSCANAPSGLLFGDYAWIAKWKNLTRAERASLHGTMDGDFRDGPVTIHLNDQAIKENTPTNSLLLEQEGSVAESVGEEFFNFSEVPEQNSCRWFVRYGARTMFDRGFRSKAEASAWIEKFGQRLDWRTGYVARLRSDNKDIEIVDRNGRLASV